MRATKFHCPACGAFLKTSGLMAEGKGIKCPRCQNVFTPGPDPGKPEPGKTPIGEEAPTQDFERGLAPEAAPAVTPLRATPHLHPPADAAENPTQALTPAAAPEAIAGRPESTPAAARREQAPHAPSDRTRSV